MHYRRQTAVRSHNRRPGHQQSVLRVRSTTVVLKHQSGMQAPKRTPSGPERQQVLFVYRSSYKGFSSVQPMYVILAAILFRPVYPHCTGILWELHLICVPPVRFDLMGVSDLVWLSIRSPSGDLIDVIECSHLILQRSLIRFFSCCRTTQADRDLSGS